MIKIPIFRYFSIDQYDHFKSSYEKMIFYYPRIKAHLRHKIFEKEICLYPGRTLLVLRFPGDMKNLEQDFVYYQLKHGFGWKGWFPLEIRIYLIK